MMKEQKVESGDEGQPAGQLKKAEETARELPEGLRHDGASQTGTLQARLPLSSIATIATIAKLSSHHHRTHPPCVCDVCTLLSCGPNCCGNLMFHHRINQPTVGHVMDEVDLGNNELEEEPFPAGVVLREKDQLLERDVVVMLHKGRYVGEGDGGVRGGDKKKKKRKMVEVEKKSEPEEFLLACSSRLRECSKYFESMLSGRWPVSGVTMLSGLKCMEVDLELQTDSVYYRDCFNRMDWPFPAQIPSVEYCIQLLKVASQIEYGELMDICVKYLAATQWSPVDEMKIREFYEDGTIALSSTSDLNERLRYPMNEEERMKETSTLTQRVLSRYLRLALMRDDSQSIEVFESRSATRQVFSSSFSGLVACAQTPVCREVLQFTLSMIKRELEDILVSMKDPGCQKGWGENVNIVNVLQFCWMYEVLREARASTRVVVELLLKVNVSRILLTFQHPSSNPLYPWAHMIYQMFQDVLDGRLFLQTSERVELYLQWDWILERITRLKSTEPCASKVVREFLMTFPLRQQEEIVLRWASSLDEYRQAPEVFDLSESHIVWLLHLVTAEVPKREVKPTCAHNVSTAKIVEYVPMDLPNVGKWDIV